MKEYFERLRFDKNHHLGLGDIRLTTEHQEEITRIFELREVAYNRLKTTLAEVKSLIEDELN